MYSRAIERDAILHRSRNTNESAVLLLILTTLRYHNAPNENLLKNKLAVTVYLKFVCKNSLYIVSQNLDFEEFFSFHKSCVSTFQILETAFKIY